MPRRSTKRLLMPVRSALGRFALSPTGARVEPLEREVAALKGQLARNELMYKVGAFVAADKIAGDYVEFGTFLGRSFSRAFLGMKRAFEEASAESPWNADPEERAERRRLWEQMRFFAFDSFEGLPDLVGIDRDTKDFAQGKFACSEDDFLRNVERQGVDLDRVTTVAGWFDQTVDDETFGRIGLRRAAVVNIDCDLYESARAILDGIEPIIADGTVIIFDDWYNFRGSSDRGEQRACREWLLANPHITLAEYHKEGSWRNSFIVTLDPDERVARGEALAEGD